MSRQTWLQFGCLDRSRVLTFFARLLDERHRNGRKMSTWKERDLALDRRRVLLVFFSKTMNDDMC